MADDEQKPGNWMWLSCSAFFSQYCKSRHSQGEKADPSRPGVRTRLLATQDGQARCSRPEILSVLSLPSSLR